MFKQCFGICCCAAMSLTLFAETPAPAENAPKPDRVFIRETFDNLKPGVTSQWNGVCSIEPLTPGAVEIVPYEGGQALKISGTGKLTFRAPVNPRMIKDGENAIIAFDLELAPGGSLYFQGGEQGKAFGYVGAVEPNRIVGIHALGAGGKRVPHRTSLKLPGSGKAHLEFCFIGKECFVRVTLPDGTVKTSPRYPRLPGGLNTLTVMSAEGKPGAAFHLDNFVITGSK